jgi:hypothetical protein
LAYALQSVERPPTARGSRRAIRFARLERTDSARFHTGALIATFRRGDPRVAARSPISGASWPATKAAEYGRETLIRPPSDLKVRRRRAHAP